MSAAIQVLARDRDHGEDRQHPGDDERREVAGQVGLDGGHPAGGEHGHLTGPVPGEVGGVQVQGGLEDRTAQRRTDPAGGAGGEDVHEPGRHDPPARHREQCERCRVPAGARRVGDHADDGRRECERLGDDEGAADRLADHDPGQLEASRSEVREDPGVERSHAGDSASCSVGMWWTAIRLRKTQ